MHIFWHQRDLRIRDNSGLAAATAADTTLPVCLVDPTLREQIGPRQWAFYINGVQRLKNHYRELGSDLLVRVGPPVETLSEIVDEYGVERLYYNRHYRPARRARQRRLDSVLPTEPVTDLVLVDPEELDSQYATHSQFYGDWQAVAKQSPHPTPSSEALANVTDDTGVPAAETDIDLPEAGYRAARARYDRFLDAGIETYNDTRDDMAAAVDRPVGAVSRLSPYLAAGMIGIREVWADATDRYETASSDAIRRNVDKFRYELSWREQNYHLLYYNPALPTENYKQFPNTIPWENDPKQVVAWKRGQTGYPLVDAGMRQLNSEGYIHNRPRQLVASFLTKHLLVDWRKGASYFADKLVDHDPASNSANWQWIASTGTDSVDVRIFDPVAQMAKYDDEAAYVTAYVPELRGVEAGTVVDWPNLSTEERQQLAPDYCEPIVDRNNAYERAQRVFENALGKR